MLASVTLLLASLLPAGETALSLNQPVVSSSRRIGMSATVLCEFSDSKSSYIHWYRQRPWEAPHRILHHNLRTAQTTMDSGFSSWKFQVDKVDDKSCSLLIKDVDWSDTGIYYCAIWDKDGVDSLVFGSGTKLIIIEGAATLKAPEPIKFFPSSLEQEKQNTESYICLFKDFYPDVIRMHWKEEGSDKILESQQSDPFRVKDKYWQMSWLTVKKSSPGKIYRLIYKHEKTGRVEKEELFPAPASVPTTTSTEASTTVETSVPTTTSTKTSTTVETSVPTPTSTEASTTVETAVPTTISTERSTSFETLRSTPPTAREACTTGPVKQVFQSVNTTAYYTYTILLLKSTTYCIFMLFLIYKRNMASGNWRELSSSHLWRKVRGRTEFPWTKRPTSLQTSTEGAEQHMDRL
nr:T cell receptor gamma chain [Ornithorhynchus anatinus]